MGCRRVAPRAELVRLGVSGGSVVVDPARRLPGRGAHLCPGRECWERAVARNAFARAFRRPVEVPVEPLHLSL